MNRPKRSGAGWKFMQVLDPKVYRMLAKEANKRRITVQELLRVVVIPNWLRLDTPEESA
jgi:hypothetical protein